MKISVIIPVWNEAGTIGKSLEFLEKNAPECQIIVVDGESSDNTCAIVQKFPKVELLKSPAKGRGAQMNFGAKVATGDLLYFLHADARPPVDFIEQLKNAVSNGAKVGCFRFRFDSKKLMLEINAWFTRLPYLWCRGGDQSFFILSEIFERYKGFDERYEVMEEYDLMVRLKSEFQFTIIPDNVVVSARKYTTNSWFKVMWANLIAYRQFTKGVPTTKIKKTYKDNLNPYL
ncbi:MAG: TIGR04283 family arsenosugar biosynthesis glycosyltransferase [Bacteroidetes bacterium]|nr:TIGR04283 family arsenosugar biosynthesis glycosyltransferase [Bacteroidota bacterium]